MKILNKILLVILLKIVEISVIIYLPCWIADFGIKIFPELFKSPPFSFFTRWFIGIMTILLFLLSLIIILFTFALILKFINFNWKLVNNGNGIEWIENFLWYLI